MFWSEGGFSRRRKNLNIKGLIDQDVFPSGCFLLKGVDSKMASTNLACKVNIDPFGAHILMINT